jgi:hypothetical protein
VPSVPAPNRAAYFGGIRNNCGGRDSTATMVEIKVDRARLLQHDGAVRHHGAQHTLVLYVAGGEDDPRLWIGVHLRAARFGGQPSRALA